ncbi:hypothetical protein CAPTEDRAFT_207567 [Capitella teleta]|uniref:Uncharacterized protein n=1 Tax=Capitella teleta TaxID=283909 RepID=R7V8L4_CAPTE|nr:hypothetical protein CAPTEDRAFT_207567 [Capitella teleta]|eukprot:ELU14857.1 hypothetical protein CAPTEDRAFT_207567 [Capitella teleta]
MEGDILRHKTLLIASRPNFLQNKLLHFESTFAVEGYDSREQLEHVKRYAEHKNIDSAPFESMLKEKSIFDLCNNPLNLTLLCLLREEDTQLMNTRTTLYTSIHSIITRKAGERLNLIPAEVEESLLRPLYQFAFEAYQKNEIVVREKDSRNLEQVCQVGYLTQELIISRFQAELLRLIGELKDVPPKLGDATVKRCPHINIYHKCSASCMRGILKLGNLRLQPPIPLNVDLIYLWDEEEKIYFVKKSIECKNIKCSMIWIDPCDHTQLRNIVSGLRIGQADSFQQVNIDCGYIKRNPCEEF